METLGIVNFSSGKYVGEVKNGKAHGYGRIRFSNGDIYMGQWKNNCMTGMGFYYKKDNWTLGSFINGKRHGRCATIIKNAHKFDFFIGTYSNDMKNGQGAYYWDSEDCYVGNFNNDKLNGVGSMSKFGGDEFYTGIYQNGLFVKQTIMYPKTVLPDGYVFFGDCNRHYHYSGDGLLVYPQNKLRLIGYHNKLGPNMTISYNFKGVKAGGNRIRCNAFSKYLIVGDFGETNYKMSGPFEKISSEGKMYLGNYREDKKNGFGIYYDGSLMSSGVGSFYMGNFVNGKLYDGVEVGSDFLVLSEGKFADGTPKDGFSLYNTNEVILAKNGSKTSSMISLPIYNGMLNVGASQSSGSINNMTYKDKVEYYSDPNNLKSVEDFDQYEKIMEKEKLKNPLLPRLGPTPEEIRLQELKALDEERCRKNRELFERNKALENKILERFNQRLKENGYYKLDDKNRKQIIGYDIKYLSSDIKIPNNITSLGNGAFKNAPVIKKVVFPSNFVSVGDEAFRGCTELVELDFSNTKIEEINSRAFIDCCNLEVLKLPSTIKKVASDNFHGCDKLKKIVLPNKVVDLEDFIKEYSHEEISGEYLLLDESKYYKYNETFYTDYKNKKCIVKVATGEKEEIIIFPKYEEIKDRAFLDVGKFVKKIVILTPNIKFSSRLLRGCNKLLELDFSYTKITNFDNLLFTDCKKLKVIRLPKTFELTKIQSLFEQIDSLEKVYWRDLIIDENNIDSKIAESKKILDNEVRKQKEIEKKKQEEYEASLLHLVISPKQRIDKNTYSCNSSLRTIDLSKWIGNIPEKAFQLCSLLKKVILPRYYFTINSASFWACKSLSEVDFPLDKVVTIKDYAFYACNSIIELKCNTDFIGNNAFKECKSLKKVEILSTSKKLKIDKEAFASCISLEEFIAPNLKKLKKRTFLNCGALKRIVVHKKCPFKKSLISKYAKIKVMKENDIKTILIER